MSKLQNIIENIEKFGIILHRDYEFISDKLKELDDIKTACPHCGTTEFLCGYNGVGCSCNKGGENDD